MFQDSVARSKFVYDKLEGLIWLRSFLIRTGCYFLLFHQKNDEVTAPSGILGTVPPKKRKKKYPNCSHPSETVLILFRCARISWFQAVSGSVIYRFQLAHLRVFQIIVFRARLSCPWRKTDQKFRDQIKFLKLYSILCYNCWVFTFCNVGTLVKWIKHIQIV